MDLEWSAEKTLLLVLLLVISAFASSSETAIFSLNRFQLRRLKDQNKSAFNRIRVLLDSPVRLLVLILLINESVNITISALIAEFVSKNFGLWSTATAATAPLESKHELLYVSVCSVLITVPLLLLVAEITPKTLAAKLNKPIATLNTKILYPLFFILRPLLAVVESAVNFMLKPISSDNRNYFSKKMSALSEEEFRVLMEAGHNEGTVNQDERELITNVLEFDDTHVTEVMTPIDKVFALPENKLMRDALHEIRIQKYSRVPIYGGTPKNIIGIFHVKHLLKLQKHPEYLEEPISKLVSPILYVSPDLTLNTLFKRLKAEKTHFSVVIDKKQNAIGIATLEDVLESIFGDIADERDVR